MSENGCGSLLVVFDLYFDAARSVAVNSPRRLHDVLKDIVQRTGMTWRGAFLDVWETEKSGPATSFHSIGESHSRISVPQFARAETWPDELHLNGEIQLCHYTRDNSGGAKKFVDHLIQRLKPVSAQILLIQRGPGYPLKPLSTVHWTRGNPLPFAEEHGHKQARSLIAVCA